MSSNSVVIVSAARTPMGGFQGVFSNFSAVELGASAIKASVERSNLNVEQVEELLFGCVLSAATGQAPARQAALAAGLTNSTGCTTINKVCGSGMKATMIAHDQIKAGSCEIAVAGGMESMSQAPYLLPQARAGHRLGHGQAIDHMFNDGLEDAYSGRLMGSFAQELADQYELSRDDMDSYAIESLKRANSSISNGFFEQEIVPVAVKNRKKEATIVDQDEQPSNANADKIPLLKPAFSKDGTVTAANSSSISDGASAMVLMTENRANELGLEPLARIVAHASHGQCPSEFSIAPITAIKQVLDKSGWKASDVDLYEINEAFAMVTLLAMHELQLDHNKVNIHGGACALGHPLGSSGARIIVTLLYALKRLNKKRGVASLCIGGGEATSVAIEMMV